MIFTLVILSVTFSCYSREKRYYGERMVKEIKKMKKRKDDTYISYQVPKLTRESARAYANKEIKHTFKARKFKNNQAVFALIASSTANYGILEKIDKGARFVIDSTFTETEDFIYLKLNPVVKGNYKLRGYGCRYGKEFDIVIE